MMYDVNKNRDVKLYVEKDFFNEYNDCLDRMSRIAGCAKIYILRNWDKVKNWSDLNIEILDNTNQVTIYYNYKPKDFHKETTKSGKLWRKMMLDFYKERHNPIKSFTEPVMDHADGDFSITINGINHLWISDENVIEIANYIEKQLNE